VRHFRGLPKKHSLSKTKCPTQRLVPAPPPTARGSTLNQLNLRNSGLNPLKNDLLFISERAAKVSFFFFFSHNLTRTLALARKLWTLCAVYVLALPRVAFLRCKGSKTAEGLCK
jgi:hypothetical protein